MKLNLSLEARRILVVDDEPGTRALLRCLLEKRGYRVDEAADGREAVSLCDQREYDLVLMDVIMPNLNGIEACRQILTAHPARHPPNVVMLTAHVDEGFILESLKAGSIDYILKPITSDNLMDSVEHALGATSRREAVAESSAGEPAAQE